VLHPFYVFQIASLILWSIDTYYYYAGCIFLMSVGSIAATLIETRSVSHGPHLLRGVKHVLIVEYNL
jgi:dolichol kinase